MSTSTSSSSSSSSSSASSQQRAAVGISVLLAFIALVWECALHECVASVRARGRAANTYVQTRACACTNLMTHPTTHRQASEVSRLREQRDQTIQRDMQSLRVQYLVRLAPSCALSGRQCNMQRLSTRHLTSLCRCPLQLLRVRLVCLNKTCVRPWFAFCGWTPDRPKSSGLSFEVTGPS